MNKRLENHPAESETEEILDDHLDRPGEAEDAGQHGARENAHAIARYRMHRRSQRLPPARRDVTFMESEERFAATEHVEESADYSGVSGQQHEPPFEHRRSGVVSSQHPPRRAVPLYAAIDGSWTAFAGAIDTAGAIGATTDAVLDL